MSIKETNVKIAPWDLKGYMLEEIEKNGGFVNAHAHLDRAFTITPQLMDLCGRDLHEKWNLVDDIKRNSTVENIYDRMMLGVSRMEAQGVSAIGTFIDVDCIIKDRSIRAAEKLRESCGKDIELKFINQTLKGVIDPEALAWFYLGAQFADIIGGLPGKDSGREAEHLDVVLGTAKSMGKMAHIHVDQLNIPAERETELLIKKTKEHGMEARVAAIHGISLAAHPLNYRTAIYQKMREAEVSVIACPSAWIDSRRIENLMPRHNSITPVDELVPNGVTVALGTDNIADIYKPFTDGDMWYELHLLLDACHYYDNLNQIEDLVKIATSNGRRVLGLSNSS